jgi:hypothetical protein
LDGSKRSLTHWILATFLLCLSCSSRRIAREVGVHISTRCPFHKFAASQAAARLYGLGG